MEKNSFPCSGDARAGGRGDSRAGCGGAWTFLCVTSVGSTCPRPHPVLPALGRWPCLWGTLHKGQGAPSILFHSSLPVASSQGRVFSSCLSGQGVNHPALGGETGSSLPGSLPSSHNLPGHLHPASVPALVPGWA